MSRLIRLYPAAWRTRYEDELIELLGRRPLRLSDRIDLARGAIDAHLHPQLADRVPQPWTHRIPGLLALTAGLLWAWSFAFLAFWADPDADWGSGFGIAFLLMLISVPGDYLFGYGRRIAIAIGVVIGGMVLGQALPWSIADGLLNVIVGATAWLVVVGGLLTLAAIRTGIGTTGRWLMLIGAVIAPVVISIPVILGLAGSGASGSGFRLVFAFFVPYGVIWAFVGLQMTLRGSQTLVDPPAQSGPVTSTA